MKPKGIIALLFTIFIINQLTLSECSSSKKIVDTEVTFESISFGKKGGFTNVAENYILQKDGKIFKKAGEEFIEIKSVNKQKLLEIQKALDALEFESLHVKEVGNMTYFIIVNHQNYKNQVTWSSATNNTEIKKFYNTLISIL